MGALLSALLARLVTPCLIDRETGKQVQEAAPFSDTLRLWLLYQTWIGQLLLLLPPTWWILSWQHHRVAKHADSPESKKDIPKFIKTFEIVTEAAEKPVGEYATLQEFFTRRLKPGLRPIAAENDLSVAVQPADSRAVVFDTVEAAHKFWIKGRHFDLGRLMGPGYDTRDHWSHAAIAINRLSPSDIHRLHAAVPGRVVKIRQRGTRFMASEHVAVHSRLDIMTENDRLVMEFESEAFGTVVQVMIGASEVGSVRPLVKEGQTVNKGDEVAVFRFGGSIMATIFGHGAIAFDDDLVTHSRNNTETLVTLGSSLGRATGRPHKHAPAPAGAQE